MGETNASFTALASPCYGKTTSFLPVLLEKERVRGKKTNPLPANLHGKFRSLMMEKPSFAVLLVE